MDHGLESMILDPANVGKNVLLLYTILEILGISVFVSNLWLLPGDPTRDAGIGSRYGKVLLSTKNSGVAKSK